MPIRLAGLILSSVFALVPAASDETHAGQTNKQEPAPKKRQKKNPEFKWVNPLPARVAKGLVHRTFFSRIANTEVGYAILLPEGYEESEARYPVVYFLHGGRPGNETKGIPIADYVVRYRQQEEITPAAIYVFNNGGPVSHYNVPDRVGIPGKPDALGADIFITELIPHIDRTYRTIPDRKARGLEGFSQGGRGTMRLALRYPELFSSVAAGGGGFETERKISESPDSAESPQLRFEKGDNAYDLARAYARRSDAPKIHLMIYVGSKGTNYQNNLIYMEFLDELGLQHTSLVVPDATHSARKVYDGRGVEIVRFHAANFAKSAE